MSISGPLKIINEGLVLALDAGNSKSYPSTGSTWFDLISGSNNGTLINGAYYTSSHPSYINFDGINDYINFSSSVYPVSGLGFTIEVVGSVDSGSSAPQRFLSKGHYGYTPGYFLGKYPSTDGRIRFVGGIGSATSVSSSAVYCYTSQSYDVGLVRHLSLLSTGTYMYLYVNGEKSNLIKATGTAGTLENETDLNYSASISGLSIATSAKFSVGNYANSNASILDEYLKGKISLVKIYNRALSYSEILINYNSVKNKYFLNFEELTATGGNSVITSGDYRIHTFTTVGTASFTLASVGSEEAITVEYLIVGGGGGGGSDMGGGGGGGGVISGITYFSTPYTATVIVGAGGAGSPAGHVSPAGKKGENSVFATFTAIGGGFGGSSNYNAGSGGYPGDGGSGGGASGFSNGGYRAGGTGTVGQGNNGGQGGREYFSGGGGGAGGAGVNSTNQPNGGVGVQNSILGISYYWGGGGGGASYTLSTGGNGGNGGGGGGAVGTTTGGTGLNNGSAGGGGSPNSQANTPGGNGGANTGGGGGGGSHYNVNNKGGNGGSGIVVIKYRYLLTQ